MSDVRKTAYQYRLHLTKGQQRILELQLEECRWVYNQTLAARRDAWEQRQETLALYDTQAMLPDWKTERKTLKLVHSQVLQNVQLRVELAFKAFFRRVKAGELSGGYPRFKGLGRYDSMTYPQYGNGARLEGNKLILSKIGTLLLHLHRPIEGRIKTVTLRRSSTGKWFVAFAVERERSAVADVPQAAVGVDVGLEKFATFSTGETIDNPRFFRGDERDLKRAQRRLSEQPKGSLERAQRRKIVARIHERIANRRKNFAHQQSRKLVRGFGVIVFEDLSITRMMGNHCLAKSIADAAWGQLASYTRYKAEEAGRAYIEVDPRGTSQRCSRCGAVVKKSLSIRVHQCPHCGVEIDRDLNAAYNILRLGLQSQGQSPQEAPRAFAGGVVTGAPSAPRYPTTVYDKLEPDECPVRKLHQTQRQSEKRRRATNGPFRQSLSRNYEQSVIPVALRVPSLVVRVKPEGSGSAATSHAIIVERGTPIAGRRGSTARPPLDIINIILRLRGSMKTHHRTRLISTVLLAGLLSLLMGCMALGLLARSRTPSFYLPVWLSQRQAIILRNGPACRPDLTRGACLSGITDRTFHIIVWQPEGSRVLLSIRE